MSLRSSGIRALRGWDPFRELGRMQAELDALLSGHTNDSYAPGHPPVGVWANEQGALVTAELPGDDPEKIEISVLDDTVNLSGSPPAEAASVDRAGDTRVLRHERGHGEFKRRVRLPFRVDPGAVDARFSRGVLHLTLPRLGAEQPRKIAVQAS